MSATRPESSPREFDLCGALPTGVTVLEASAGTGKTYTIAALATRYVAEGVPLERMLLITFTRMATGELRDRVRERLVRTEERLSRALDGVLDTTDDEIVALLAIGTPSEVERRRERLLRAIANFDAATIATTHGFCQEVLAELGTIGDLEPDTEFVEDISDLIEEVLDDLYIRRFQKRGGPPFSRAEALRIARAAVANPGDRLEPEDSRGDAVAAMRYRLASAVREELERRKRQMGIMTYDDLLTRLAGTLKSSTRGPAAALRLRARYCVVLVDEFQDTDPIQWQILHRAFACDGVTLVLIADPKQAIYAFRGADVYAYLAAAKTAASRATLQMNRRSDQPLLDAYDALCGNARLGHPGIVYRRVRATSAHSTSRLLGAPAPAPVRLRVAHRDESSIAQTPGGLPETTSAREHVAADLAQELVALLSSPARIEQRDGEGRRIGVPPIRAGDIAVLVRTHSQADLIRVALEEVRVPAVINGAGSVFATDSARDWLRLLEAIDRPANSSRARSAALTPFIGWSAERIAGAGEEQWEQVHRRLHRWNRVLRDQGVAELTETIMIGEDLAARILSQLDGERGLTDLRHLAQLLHRVAATERLGVTALRGWLVQQIAATEQEGEEERTRRLESDAQAVQILTIHRSKGLEFPIVCCPFLWVPGWRRDEPEPVFFHDPALGNLRTIDVGLGWPGWAAHVRQHHIEERGEELRLLYVALTRARHQAIVWWASAWMSQHSPLGRLLLAREDDGTVPADGGRTVPHENAVINRVRELSAVAPGAISVERSRLGASRSWRPRLPAAASLHAATFDRQLDLCWRRTSYSDITSGAHDAAVTSEPEAPGLSDEPGRPESVVDESPVSRLSAPGFDMLSPLGGMPVGVEFGTFVHRVLEATDFAAADLEAELAERIDSVLARRRLYVGEREEIVAGLRAAIETPLGRAVGNRRLRDLVAGDRLDELGFELPLVGGDDPSGRLTLTSIADTLRRHLPGEDVLAAYAARLDDPALRNSVRGFLTGSIDLVIRLAGPRFAIVDYKTNWLGTLGEELTLGHYAPPALAAEMSRAHYALQALLYMVALHRYLRWRLPGYDPDEHIAGALYLFLRGMGGTGTPRVDGVPCGVFAWKPPGALLCALSDTLDHGAAR
ncbi:MAG: UvrD-helicase domain-containing protein [Solirubrobacteraceae bacterium]